VCQQGGSCDDNTTTIDYAIKVTAFDNSTNRTITYTNLDSGTHWFHVIAKDRAGNWNNPSHYKINIDAVPGAPQITYISPVGITATTSPRLIVETNEDADCYYNSSASSWSLMFSINGTRHEAQLSGLTDGSTYSYRFNCSDDAGNFNDQNTTTFTVNTSAVADGVVIETPLGPFVSGQVATAYVDVTFGGNPLDGQEDNFIGYVDNEKIYTEVDDLGGGRYSVEFTAPINASTYTLGINVSSVSDTETFTVYSYTLTMSHSGGGVSSGPGSLSNVAYGSGSGYVLGFGSESGTISTAGGPQIQYTSHEGYNFIFLTKTSRELSERNQFLVDNEFMAQISPSFGYRLRVDEYLISAFIDYENVEIEGDQQTGTGIYTLIIKNEGVDPVTGKIRVSVTIT
jgi:hypothetical protein